MPSGGQDAGSSPAVPLTRPRPRRSPAHPSAVTASDSMVRVDFAQYYAQHMVRLTRFVMRHGATAHEAADAAQAAFTAAFPQWAAIERPAAWLRTVAVRQFLRRPGPQEAPVGEVPDEPAGCGPLDEVMVKEEGRRVLAALSGLPMRQRCVMAWHLDGFSHGEIADALAMSPAAVRQNLHRARTALKQALITTTGSPRPEGGV
ncbi:RNA polymerase sigma factor [Streptomyces monticola]|uniref:RNA polymerase sigma factor n=1 Tax=Streptomyces monticola TaxID=2666263 RepID=A0ABW2JGN8_9ACTN